MNINHFCYLNFTKAKTRCIYERVEKNWAGIRERGVTLVMSLIFLLLLTLLGITAMSTSTLQEKMSGNLRDQDVAFQAAESALRGGEDAVNQLWLLGKPTPISNPTCPANTNCAWDLGVIDPFNNTWWSANRIEYGSSSKDLPETSADPGFVIEYLQFDKYSIEEGSCYGTGCKTGLDYYRITSRAQGTTSLSQSMLESTYKIER